MASIAQGKIGSIVANCITQQSRIDFNLLPTPRADISFALIKETAQIREELSRIIDAVRRDAVSSLVSRVAVFLHFIILAPSLSEANRLLLENMPALYRMGITDEEDFSFQVNRPHMIGNVRMNFITKWSADRFRVFNISVPMVGPIPGQLGQSPVSLQPAEFFGASVTFDSNNIPPPEPLDIDKQAALLNEGLTRPAQMQREWGMNIEGF